MHPSHKARSTPMPEAIDMLLRRRSVLAPLLSAPGPGAQEIDTILTVGARVPDHGKLAPWRFILFEGEARARFGDVLASAFLAANADAPADRVEAERGRFLRAPLVICVVSRARPHFKIPEWEQVLSAGAVCQNLLHAAHALGFAGQWLTEWYAYDEDVCAALGLEEGERVAGFVYVGTPTTKPDDRVRPDIAAIRSAWAG